jgi:hypothetical protein
MKKTGIFGVVKTLYESVYVAYPHTEYSSF